MVKLDYFNRIRVLVTQVMPSMIGNQSMPAELELKIIMKDYDTFNELDSIQAKRVLQSYQGAYIQNLHLLIKKLFKEVKKE